MVSQPTGAVTLLFTDLEGSTRLLRQLGTTEYAQTLESHRRLPRQAFDRFDGYEFGTEGDAFFVAFARPDDAVSAARIAQQALAAAEWPAGVQLRVRMGLHTGQPVPSGSNYVGMDLHRVARIMSAGHGGQVLVSETTRALLDGVGLRDLGPHRLKDLLEPVRLYQLEIEGLPEEFPPLRSLHRTNLPVAAWPLLGRERELETIRRVFSGGGRLLTLTGPGGSGKTRLALQAAGELSDGFADGVFYVALAPLRQSEAVRAAIAEAVGLQPQDDVAAWLGSRRVLLVLDNLEHLVGVDAVVSGLLVNETVVLCTARGPLRLTTEQELAVDPLPDDAAAELFVSRAAAVGRRVEADQNVAAICRRLDNLPLALELAAARSKLLSPAALLTRLDEALPLLTGGANDRPERHRTLRATIEWSYDLLDPDARAAFRRLSVFRGSFTLDAAEKITGAELEHIALLVDQSLVKPLGDDRLFMLETLREFARDQLGSNDETEEYVLRHANFYLSQLETNDPGMGGPDMGRLLRWSGVEEDNLRAMLDCFRSRPADASRALELLFPYWWGRCSYTEARSRLRELPDSELSHESQALVHTRLATLEDQLGNLDAAEAASDRAVAAAEASGGHDTLATALRQSGWVKARRDQWDQALERMRRAAEMAESLDIRINTRHDLGALLGEAGHGDEARVVFEETLKLAGPKRDQFLTISVSIQIGFIDLFERRFEDARTQFGSAVAENLEIGHYGADVLGRWGLGYALLGLSDSGKARATFVEALDHVVSAPQPIPSHVALIASGIAHTANSRDALIAARLRGAIVSLRASAAWQDDPRNVNNEHFFDRPLIESVGEDAWQREQHAATGMSLTEIVQLAQSLASGTASGQLLDWEHHAGHA